MTDLRLARITRGPVRRLSGRPSSLLAGLILLAAFGAATPAAAQFPGSCAGSCGARASAGCWCDNACFSYGDCCSDIYSACFTPIVSNVAPTTAPTAGGTVLTITGTNLLPPTGSPVSVVTLDGAPCPVEANPTTSSLRCTVRAGQGAGNELVVRHDRPNGNQSSPYPFSYTAPTLSQVEAASRPTAGGTTLTLTGSNFGTASVVEVGGQNCPVTQQGHDLLECTLPAGQGAALDLVVHAGNQQVATPFSYDAPALTQISPASAPSSGGSILTLTGSNFGTASAVEIGGAACPVVEQGHGMLRCTLPPGSGINLPVTVGAGSQTSNSALFSYTGLQIDSLTPANGPTAGNVPITIVGSGFDVSNSVSVGGNTCTLTGATPTQIVCTLPPGQGRDVAVHVSGAGQTSNRASFAYDAPVISSITPMGASTAGGSVLTINGSNFGLTPTASVGSASCPVLPGSTHTRVTCTLPAGEGVGLPVSVEVVDQTSNTALFGYGAPSLDSIFPTSATTAGNIPLTVNGANFGLTATVSVDGRTCPITQRGHSQLVCTLPAGSGANANVVATVSGRTSNPLTFTYSGPHISSITPASAPSSGNVPLTINGTSFTAGDMVAVGGSSCPVTGQTSTRLVCTLPAGQGAARSVQVNSGGVFSNAASFDYDPPAITGVSTASTATAGGSLLTLTGSSFGTSGTVAVDGNPCPISSYGHSMVTCTLPAGQGANVGVVLTSAGRSSNSFAFTYSAPVIASIFPTSGTAAGNIPLTINGTNFGTASAVTVAGRNCPVTSQGHGSLICTLPAGEGSAAEVRVAAGNQTSNADSFAYSAPMLSGVTPSSGPTAGGISLTLTGTNFGAANVVTVGGAACPVTQQSATSVECTLPAGQGVARNVQLAAGDQSTGTLPFSYGPPAITGVVPASGPTAGNIPITVVGTNFGTSGSVTVGGASCPASLHDHSRILCTLPAGSAGTRILQVTVAGQSGSIDFTYEAPTPTATATATPTPTPTPLCAPTPRSDCRAPGKSLLTLRDKDDDARDQLIWTWTKGEATVVGDFGDPQTATDYRFCLYDPAQPVIELRLAPGGICARDKPCWKTDKSPYRYADSAGSASGITKLQLKAAEAGKASVQLRGKGVNLPDLSLPLTTPVTAQLVNANGTCWSATYSGPASKSEPDFFKIGYTAP